MNTDFMKQLNRQNCFKLFTTLIGKYSEYCDAYNTYKKENGNYAYTDETKKNNFDIQYKQQCERFCGSFYANGANPYALPHPIQVALSIRYNRDITESLKNLGYGDFYERVIRKCQLMSIPLKKF